MEDTSHSKENLALIEKVNAVFLGTRDFQELAGQAAHLMAQELEGEGVAGVAIFRVRPEENSVYAYAYASRAFAAVNKLFPKKFSQLNVSLSEESNLLVRAVQTRREQESNKLYDFARPALNELTSAAIQRTIGFSHAIAYPIRLKQGKVAGVVLFVLDTSRVEERQSTLLEAFRSQLERAFENVFEFEQVVERYKRNAAKDSPKAHQENIPTVRFTLRITPKQNSALARLAKKEETDKATFLRSLINEAAKK